MAQRFLFEEDYGWPTRIVRSVIWSGAMGILWVLPWVVFAICALSCMSFMEARHPVADAEYDGFGMVFFFLAVSYGAAMSFVAGAVIGLSAGLGAAPEEHFSPFHARRFRSPFEWVVLLGMVMILGVIAVVAVDFIPNNIF